MSKNAKKYKKIIKEAEEVKLMSTLALYDCVITKVPKGLVPAGSGGTIVDIVKGPTGVGECYTVETSVYDGRYKSKQRVLGVEDYTKDELDKLVILHA